MNELKTRLGEHGSRYDISDIQKAIEALQAANAIYRIPRMTKCRHEVEFLWLSSQPPDASILLRKRQEHEAYLKAIRNKAWSGGYAEALITETLTKYKKRPRNREAWCPFEILATSEDLLIQKAFFEHAGLTRQGYVDFILSSEDPRFATPATFALIEVKNRGQWEYASNPDLQRFISMATEARDKQLRMLFVFIARRIHGSAKRRLKHAGVLYHESRRQFFHPDAHDLVTPAKEGSGLTFIEVGRGSECIRKRQARFIKEILYNDLRFWSPPELPSMPATEADFD